MAALHSRSSNYILQLWFLSFSSFLFFFLAYSQRLEIGCLPYFHTWCGLSVNLQCMFEMCCTRLGENTGCKNYAKNRHLRTIARRCRAISLQLRHLLTIGKLVKQQYLLHMSWQKDELQRDQLVSLGHHSKLQWVSRLGFITAPTSLSGGQPDFARCLAVSCIGTLCIHFGGSGPLTEFCQVQNSLCVQVLRSPTLAASLNGTRAVCMSKTLWHGTRNGITELSLLVTFNRGRATYIPRVAITFGIGPQSSFCLTFFIDNCLLWTALCDHCICTRH